MSSLVYIAGSSRDIWRSEAPAVGYSVLLAGAVPVTFGTLYNYQVNQELAEYRREVATALLCKCDALVIVPIRSGCNNIGWESAVAGQLNIPILDLSIGYREPVDIIGWVQRLPGLS